MPIPKDLYFASLEAAREHIKSLNIPDRCELREQSENSGFSLWLKYCNVEAIWVYYYPQSATNKGYKMRFVSWDTYSAPDTFIIK